jgi:hypothetical protein
VRRLAKYPLSPVQDVRDIPHVTTQRIAFLEQKLSAPKPLFSKIAALDLE